MREGILLSGNCVFGGDGRANTIHSTEWPGSYLSLNRDHAIFEHKVEGLEVKVGAGFESIWSPGSFSIAFACQVVGSQGFW